MMLAGLMSRWMIPSSCAVRGFGDVFTTCTFFQQCHLAGRLSQRLAVDVLHHDIGLVVDPPTSKTLQMPGCSMRDWACASA